MSQKYIDAKVTIWQRYYFEEDTDMNLVVEALKSGKTIINICDESFSGDEDSINYGFTMCETINNTEIAMSPEDNQGFHTIEVYDTDELTPIYTNA